MRLNDRWQKKICVYCGVCEKYRGGAHEVQYFTMTLKDTVIIKIVTTARIRAAVLVLNYNTVESLVNFTSLDLLSKVKSLKISIN